MLAFGFRACGVKRHSIFRWRLEVATRNTVMSAEVSDVLDHLLVQHGERLSFSLR